ncbi:C-C chemokine receptor type 6 [Ictalurus punctatus]|uniref:C-C chemokine receptor type 6 n=1 Tax=Ictalurus punctatus TaxID=7998 RepID=A0A2D0RJU2_ICTPU|nr:C-C chemokine receptor type 6 [Ictalurus punctatus]
MGEQTTSPDGSQPSDYYNYDDEDQDYDELCDIKSKTNVTYQIYSFICALGLLGNVLVLVTYAFYKKAKTMTDIYLVNVAVVDLLFVLALPLIIYNEQYNWSMGTWACKVLRGSYSINLYCSLLLLACISGDRYIAIVKARRSFGFRSRAQIYSRLLCTIIWLFAIVLSLPTFIYSDLGQDYINGTLEIECSLTFATNGTAQLMKILLPSTQVSVGFFIPLLVMGFCYCSIIYTLLRAQNYQRHKALRVVLAVVLVFILCHLPYNVTLLIHTIRLFKQRDCNAEQNIHLVLSVTRSVAYLHCCLNPILYAFIGVNFRNHFLQIIEDLWCLGKKYFSSRPSSHQTSELYISAHKSITAPHNENPSSFTM